MPVSVIEPATHAMHSPAFVDPLPATYLPTSQSMQDESVDAVEYLPATHAVHVVAPAAMLVSVIDPKPHSLQALLAETDEYLPAGQAMHVLEAVTGW